jgi:hypothetical protein
MHRLVQFTTQYCTDKAFLDPYAEGMAGLASEVLADAGS